MDREIHEPEPSSLTLFGESLSYELNRSLRGVAELIGAEGRVAEPVEPQQAADLLGQNAQMLGRAAGGLLPMLGIAIGTRYGFGKVLAHEAQAAEHAFLKRTTVGLSVAESGTTGFLYGSLLTPTEGSAKDDLGSFASERVRSGASSGLAFALMSASSIGLSKLASTELGAAIGAERLMRIGAVNGIVSGIPGGIANVEADSFVRTGKLDFDREHLGKSMYEMALFGGTFGLGAGMLARVRTAGKGIGQEGGEPAYQTETEFGTGLPGTPGQHRVLVDHSGGAVSNLAAEAKPAEIAGKIVSLDWTRESLVKAISAGRRDFYKADLRGLDLEGINFAFFNLDEADFSGSNLRGVDFSKGLGCLERANFDGADLSGVDFSGRYLEKASFKGAMNLAQTKFDRAKLAFADFSGSDLKTVDFRKVGDLRFVKFEGARLAGANLSGIDLNRARFGNANLTNAILESALVGNVDFRGSILIGANFSQARGFRNTEFDGATLTGANFKGANLSEVNFVGAKSFGHVVFDDASLSFAKFSDCDLTGVDFSKAEGLWHAHFSRANLDHVSFSGQHLDNADFTSAKNLGTANFAEARLRYADLSNADLRNVDFSKAANLAYANFAFADLAGADFSERWLAQVQFTGAKHVTAAKFAGADIRSASFSDTDLTISHYYPPDSEIMQRGLGDRFIPEYIGLAKFICVNPVAHKRIFEREIQRGVSADYLSEERFLGLAGLEGHYGEDSPVTRALLDVEDDVRFLVRLDEFIKQEPAARSAFVAEQVLSGATAQELHPVRLTALMKLANYLGSHPGELQQLIDLETRGDVALDGVSDFIQEEPEAHKQILLQELEKSAAQDTVAGQFDYQRLKALSSLSSWFGKNSDLMQQIFKLEKEGLKLTEVAELLNEDPVKQAHVQTLIAKGGTVEQVRKALGEDAGRLAQYLSPADAEYMDKLVGDGLRSRQLTAFIADNPLLRLEQVESLIKNRVTVKRLHDQMNLSMLPDDVSTALLDSSNVAVPQVIGPMRNWQSGPYFRDLLIEKVRGGEAISRLDIETLSQRAQELADATGSSMPTVAQSVNQGGGAAQVGLELFARDSGGVEAGKAAEATEASSAQSDTGSQLDERTFPITNPRAIETARIISEAIEQITKHIPEEKTIVVLGRDALPLYPALKNHGRKVQYFLWSRLQENDAATGEQWMREVGPGAVVIDTGYSGSIPNAIRRVDPTASAFLLSSASEYPQLLQRHDHLSIVNNLEYFPKLIARSRTYTERGGAVARQGNWDEHDYAETIKNRWTVESLNRQFLRAIGLDEWGVWRYSRYAGLTPEERLGLNTREEVVRHYARVKEERAAANNQ